MSVVVIEVGKNGKIELTKEELERMLNRAYEEGRASVSNTHWWYTTTPNWYVTTTASGPSNEVAINGLQISSDKITI